MICVSCRFAGEWNASAVANGSQDDYDTARDYHSVCLGNGCFCQHALGPLVQRP